MDHPTMRTHIDGDAAVTIELSGTVGREALASVQHLLVEVLMRRRPRRVVVDTHRAVQVDALVLGALIAAVDTAHDLGINMSITSL